MGDGAPLHLRDGGKEAARASHDAVAVRPSSLAALIHGLFLILGSSAMPARGTCAASNTLNSGIHRGLGLLETATGQQEQTSAALSMVMEIYRGMDMTFWLPETEAALAQMEGC